MKSITGTVTRLYTAQEVGGNKDGISVYYVVQCMIDDQPVKMTLPDMPFISLGDTIAVAGKMRRGQLIGIAYRNLSTGVGGHRSTNLFLGVVVLPILFGILTTIFPPAVFLVIGVPIYYIGAALRTMTACRIVRNSTVPVVA